MILDLHSHSIQSDDGRAKVENYCKWIRQRELPIDGFVLTEHRQFDTESDYAPLERLEDDQKSSAFRYEIFRQSPYEALTIADKGAGRHCSGSQIEESEGRPGWLVVGAEVT